LSIPVGAVESRRVDIGEHPPPALIDGAIGLALATAAPLRDRKSVV